jgi:hypothetical protein
LNFKFYISKSKVEFTLVIITPYNVSSDMPALERRIFMSRDIKGNHKHLILEGRIILEKSLDQDLTFKTIAKYIKESHHHF